jgi:hypothetical protein
MCLAPSLVMVLFKHHHQSSKTSLNAYRELVAYQRAIGDRKEIGVADSPLKKLDTSNVCKVGYILIAVHMLMCIQGSLD